MPSVRDQFDESMATQAPLRIPLAEYTAQLATDAVNDGLIPFMRVSDSGMHAAEAEQLMAEYEQIVQQEEAKALDDVQVQAANEAQVQAVRDRLTEQLSASGRVTPQVARDSAKLAGEFYRTVGAKMGMTPEQFADTFALNVTGARVDAEGGVRFEQALESQPPKGWRHSVSGDDAVDLWNVQSKDEAVFWTGIQGNLASDAPMIAGYSHSISRSAVAHIRENHTDESGERARGQVPITSIDLAFIPEIIASYDAIRTDLVSEQGAQRVAYAKRAQGGVLVYIEDVSRKRSDMRAVSMWKFRGSSDPVKILENVFERDAKNKKARSNSKPLGGALRPLSDYESDAQTPSPDGIVDGYGIYKQGAEDARGFIRFDPAGITNAPSLIALLEKADNSTFLHELGHYFFEVYNHLATLPDTPAEVKSDMAALVKFAGVESVETWQSMFQSAPGV